MAKCVICGKSGLFLKVDNQGRCESCYAELIREEQRKLAQKQKEEEDFNLYYGNLLRRFSKIRSEITLDNNPIRAMEVIPSFENKVDQCDQILAEIRDPRNKKALEERLTASILYSDDYHKRLGLGEIKAWGINTVIGNPLSCLESHIVDMQRDFRRSIINIKNNAIYQQTLDSIPSYKIIPTDTHHSKLSVTELDDLIKYSNVTAKTNADKLGCFIAIDTETTGLSPSRDSLVEVAAIRFEDWKPVEKFQTLINPDKHIPADATEVHGITDEMVSNAPFFSHIIDSLSTFIGSLDLVGHNLSFDLKFLYHSGLDFTNQKRKYYDTCELAKRVLKQAKKKWDREENEYVVNDNVDYDVENYKLVTLCDYYNLRDNSFAHRALSDSYSTGLLFHKLVDEKTGE